MKKVIIAALVLAALAAIVGLSMRGAGRDKGAKVYVEEARSQSLGQVVKASGAIDPRIKVNISAHVIGKIERLYVEEGDRIEKGQPFLTLEKEAYIAERDRWAAQLRRNQTEIRQAQVSLADARLKLDRARRLQGEGIVTREQLESAELAYASAELQLEDARDAVRQTQANVDKARDDLGKTTIFAPLSGRVVALNAEEGEVVVSGTMNNAASVIGTIADLSEILANVDVDETEIVSVRPGQRATIRVDALPDRVYHGRVVKIGSSGFSKPAQPDVTFFDVEILLDNPSEDLRPEMSLRAEIETRPAASTLAVPIQAVVQRERRAGDKSGGEVRSASADAPAAPDDDESESEIKVVYVVENGKVRERPVRTGVSDETRVEILEGVKPGDKVVTGPFRSLRDLKDGAAVRVTTPDEDEKDRKDKKDGEDDAEVSVEAG
ncbi:MAG TPA: efflux RND transporter periplasmic adaptor subunit [Thermoanaerobaculia bacterium]|nr:efflux RND transporter periplasmic adaptor subunit [Thermoanaerobaculia bacterium]